MKRTSSLLCKAFAVSTAAALSLNLAAQQASTKRDFLPEDLFRVRQVGARASVGLLFDSSRDKPTDALDQEFPLGYKTIRLPKERDTVAF